MPVIEWQADTIQSQASEELGIVLHEEVFEKLVKEEFLLLFAQDLQHSSSVLELMTGISGSGLDQ